MYKNVCHHFFNEMGVVLTKSGCGQQKFSVRQRAHEKRNPRLQFLDPPLIDYMHTHLLIAMLTQKTLPQA